MVRGPGRHRDRPTISPSTPTPMTQIAWPTRSPIILAFSIKTIRRKADDDCHTDSGHTALQVLNDFAMQAERAG
jgi:hypothetical protein